MQTFQIQPLTAKQRRRLHRPSALVFRKSIRFVFGVMAFVCIVACLALTGCKFNSSGWPVIPFMNNGGSQRAALTPAQRDALVYAYNNRLDERFAPPNASRSALAVQPAAQTIYAKFTAPREYDGFNLYGGTNVNRSEWRLLTSTTNTTIPIQTVTPGRGLFGLKAFLRNGIDGAETESGWATTP